jgi:DNA primase
LFPQQFIDDLRLQADILQVVQEHVPLKRAGASYKGLCPFHAEKTPSFIVHPGRGFFHCFGCGVGGDVFKFVELHEKVGFQDAVRLLAQKVGMAVPEVDSGGDESSGDAGVREALLKIHDTAAAYFRVQLAAAAAAKARQQLKERGIAEGTIAQLGLGFAPPSRDGLMSHLLKQGFSKALVLQSGLVQQRENGETVDRFRNRLMVPICRETGSVVAFGGRSIEADQIPKYLNSPETPIYSKGRTLYGLHLTKAEIRKLGYAVLVEGYFDFAQLFQTQAAPAVALCGTALTVPQARLLRRFTTKAVLSFDPDPAGQGAAARSCDLLVSEGFEVNVVALDRSEDPDVFIRRKGAGEYRERLRTSRPYLEYLLDQAAAGVDFRQDDGRRQFLGSMLGVAARIPDAAARDQFADRIAHKARITEEVVRAEIRKAAVARRATLPPELSSLGRLKPAEKGLIWGIFHRTEEAVAALRELDSEDFEQLAGGEIFAVTRTLDGQSPDVIPSELLRRLSTLGTELATGVAGQDVAPIDPSAGLAECARVLKRLRCERERAAVQHEIDRLQASGSPQGTDRVNGLLSRKRSLAQRIEELA